jgi:hypothetical protein
MRCSSRQCGNAAFIAKERCILQEGQNRNALSPSNGMSAINVPAPLVTSSQQPPSSGWDAQTEPASGKTHYANSATSQSQLENPTVAAAALPPPSLASRPILPLLVTLDRVQSQVYDANIGARSLNSLFGMLDPIRIVSLETALLGDGNGEPCLLSMDIATVGVLSKPTRVQLVAMINWARSMVKDSVAARMLPSIMHGIHTIDLLAAVFLYTVENPYPLYCCITVPLNVSGARSLQSLLHQLPFLKLLYLGMRCLPRDSPYYFRGAMYRGVDIKKNPSFKAKYDTYASAYQVGTTVTFAAPTSFSISDHAAGTFCNGIQFVVPDGAGTKLHDLSAFDDEGEVVVDGPSSWEVTAATMTPTGTLVVILKRISTTLMYYTQYGDRLLNAALPIVPPVSRDTRLVAPQPVRAHAAHGASPLLSLSVKQVALLVQSVNPAFSKYARAVAQHDVTGGFLVDATDEELSDMFKDMKVATAHRVDLRKAVATWRADPQKAMQAIRQEKRRLVDEEAARQRHAEEMRQLEVAKAAEAERQRQAEQNRIAAAERAKILADPLCVVYKQYAYRVLLHGSAPSCQKICSVWREEGFYRTLDCFPGWEICPNTPDAVHVCATHPWGASALIFSDGSAHCTQASQQPGRAVGPPGHGQYYTNPNMWLNSSPPQPRVFMTSYTPSYSTHYGIPPCSQVAFSQSQNMDYLLRRSLPE